MLELQIFVTTDLLLIQEPSKKKKKKDMFCAN